MSRRGRRTSCWGRMSIGSRAWVRAGNGGEDRPEAPSEEQRRGEQERGAKGEMRPWGEEERWPWVARVKGKKRRWECGAKVRRGARHVAPEWRRERRWELVGIVMVSPSETAREGPEGARPKGDH